MRKTRLSKIKIKLNVNDECRWSPGDALETPVSNTPARGQRNVR